MSARARLRIGESVSEARAFRAEVTAWRKTWNTIDALGSHQTQLDLLTNVTLGLTDEIAARTEAIDEHHGIGETYDVCRDQDRKLLHARRLWQWYADKLDQRVGRDDARTQTLKAADEIIWSCWKTAFTALGEETPAAPIAYLAPEFSASATPRSDIPHGLRPGKDDLLRKHLEELPVPVIGLPPICCRRPWWLILAAHETGHHLQFEIAGFEEQTQEAVAAAAHQATGEVADEWDPWCRELFADTCSVLLTGPAAIWAVRELETRPTAAMRKSPAVTYPPPVVRLALMNAVAEQAGLPAAPPTGYPADQDDDPRLHQLLDCVPVVARALIQLTAPSGCGLRHLVSQTVRAYSEPGAISGWRAELTGPDDPFQRQSLDAARFCVAGGVAAWQRLAEHDDVEHGDIEEPQHRLARRLRAVLPLCREPGIRAARTVRPSAAAITRQFLADMDGEGSRA